MKTFEVSKVLKLLTGLWMTKNGNIIQPIKLASSRLESSEVQIETETEAWSDWQLFRIDYHLQYRVDATSILSPLALAYRAF